MGRHAIHYVTFSANWFLPLLQANNTSTPYTISSNYGIVSIGVEKRVTDAKIIHLKPAPLSLGCVAFSGLGRHTHFGFDIWYVNYLIWMVIIVAGNSATIRSTTYRNVKVSRVCVMKMSITDNLATGFDTHPQPHAPCILLCLGTFSLSLIHPFSPKLPPFNEIERKSNQM